MPMVRTPTLEIEYYAFGPDDGAPIVLLHGFPDDAHAYDRVAPPLADRGYRVLVPNLRGYGATRFLDAGTPRMAQQAAIGQDLLDFLDALSLDGVGLAGYDWGGRAACLTAILAPERVRGLVTIGGYNVQNTVRPPGPAAPHRERMAWYQWYFNTERGRQGLAANRYELCRYLWRDWSPTWTFDETEYATTAASFDNPDFVDIVVHSYRHRHGNAPGEPRFDAIEQRLAQRPPITVPTVILHGGDDAVAGWPSEREVGAFPALRARRIVPGVGHFMPREAPPAVIDALCEVLR